MSPRPAVMAGAAAPIRSCSRWGLPCRRRCRRRGALLPHRFTRARRVLTPRDQDRTGGLFSVALSLGSPPPAVNRHRIPVEPGLSSIVFRRQRSSGRLARGTWAGVGGGVNGAAKPVPLRSPEATVACRSGSIIRPCLAMSQEWGSVHFFSGPPE